MNRGSSSKKDWLWLSGAQIFQTLSGAPISFVQAWILGPEDFAVFKVFQMLLAYSLITQFGTTSALSRILPINLAEGKEGRNIVFQNTVFTFQVLTTVVVCIFFIFSFLLGYTYKDSLNSIWDLIILIPLLFMSKFSVLLNKMITGEGHYQLRSKLNLFVSVLNTPIVLMLVIFFKLKGAILSLGVLYLIEIIYIMLKAKYRFRFSFNIEYFKELLPSSGFSFFGNFIGKSFWLLQMTLLGYLGTKKELGIFAFCITCTTAMRSVPQALHAAILRDMALKGKEYLRSEEFIRDDLFYHTNSFFLICVLFFGGSTVFIFETVNEFLPKYSEAVSYLGILFIALCYFQFRIFSTFALNLLDKFKTLISARVIVIALCLVISYVLIQKYRLLGAVLGLSSGMILTTWMILIFLKLNLEKLKITTLVMENIKAISFIILSYLFLDFGIIKGGLSVDINNHYLEYVTNVVIGGFSYVAFFFLTAMLIYKNVVIRAIKQYVLKFYEKRPSEA